MNICQATRLESFTLTKPKIPTRQSTILEVLGNNEMTAREIAMIMGFQDLNYVKPRITELKKKGYIEEVGTKYDPFTDRKVCVYKKKATADSAMSSDSNQRNTLDDYTTKKGGCQYELS